MKPSWSLGLCLLVTVLATFSAVGESLDDPTKTDNVLVQFETPELAPGEIGSLIFTLRNSYNGTMMNATLRVEIYKYSSLNVEMMVDGSWKAPYFVESGGQFVSLGAFDLAPSYEKRIELHVATSQENPHGSVFDPGTYFVRFWLEFDYLDDGNQSKHHEMLSPGYYSPDEWKYAVRDPSDDERSKYNYKGNMNYSFLSEKYGLQGLVGILPDSSFVVKDRMPLWPFYAIAALAVTFGFLALLLFALENPKTLPRLHKAAIALANAMRRFRVR